MDWTQIKACHIPNVGVVKLSNTNDLMFLKLGGSGPLKFVKGILIKVVPLDRFISVTYESIKLVLFQVFALILNEPASAGEVTLNCKLLRPPPIASSDCRLV